MIVTTSDSYNRPSRIAPVTGCFAVAQFAMRMRAFRAPARIGAPRSFSSQKALAQDDKQTEPAAISSLTVARQRGILTRFPLHSFVEDARTKD